MALLGTSEVTRVTERVPRFKARQPILIGKEKMMIRKNPSTLSIGLMLAGVFSFCAAQVNAAPSGGDQDNDNAHSATLVVDDDKVQCPNAGFTSIQAAVNAASSGDRINVCPGTYREQVKVTKPLTIRGVEVANQHLSLVKPDAALANSTSTTTGNPIAAIILVEGTDKVTLTHLAVDGTNNGLADCATNLVGIYYRNASGTVNDMAVRNIQLAPSLFGCQAGIGVFVQSGGGGRSRVDILDSSIHDYQKNGIVASEARTEVHISGNAVSGIGPTPLIAQNGIQVSFGAKGIVDNNSVINHLYSQCTPANCAFFAANILIFDSDGVTVSGNSTGNAQVNVYYQGNRGEVSHNTIFQSPVFDGIDLVGDRNRASDNNIKNSGAEGVYVLGNRNEVSNNTINEAPIGIFQDTPSSNNHFNGNDFDNVGLNVVSAPTLAAKTSQSAFPSAGRNASAARP